MTLQKKTQEAVSSEFGSFLQAYTAIWNTHDGNALAALFTREADLIMGNLPRIVGREAIGEWWKTYFSRIVEDRKGAFELLSLKELTPEVMLVNIASKTFGVNEHGAQLETRLARGTWIIVKRNAVLQIAALDLFVQPFDHVGRAQTPAMGLKKSENDQAFGQVLVGPIDQGRRGLGVFIQ